MLRLSQPLSTWPKTALPSLLFKGETGSHQAAPHQHSQNEDPDAQKPPPFYQSSRLSSGLSSTLPSSFPVIKPLQPDLFSPSKLPQGQNRFTVVGDAGFGGDDQAAIGTQMKKLFDQKPFASVLVLGDNVYDDGQPELFEERIHKPYQPLFDSGVKFFPVLGNHDVRKGFGPAQLQYWGAPAFYKVTLGNAPNQIDCFALDTTAFLPGYDDAYKDSPALAEQLTQIQLQWLDKALSEAKSPYKLVFGHYPLYSSGLHGRRHDVTLKLRSLLEPILTKHQVDVYLAGHEHHYEKSKPIQGVTHFISGGGGHRRRVFYQNDPPYLRDKAIPAIHFMQFEMTDLGLKYQAIGKAGDLVDEGLIPRKKRPEVTAGPSISEQGSSVHQVTLRFSAIA